MEHSFTVLYSKNIVAGKKNRMPTGRFVGRSSSVNSRAIIWQKKYSARLLPNGLVHGTSVFSFFVYKVVRDFIASFFSTFHLSFRVRICIRAIYLYVYLFVYLRMYLHTYITRVELCTDGLCFFIPTQHLPIIRLGYGILNVQKENAQSIFFSNLARYTFFYTRHYAVFATWWDTAVQNMYASLLLILPDRLFEVLVEHNYFLIVQVYLFFPE